jgi:hypothetical protein
VTPARIYPALFGTAWPRLHESLRGFFGSFGAWKGRFDVRRGGGLFGRLVGGLMRLPRAGRALPTSLEVAPHGDGEQWSRTFGDCRLVTWQRVASPALLTERVRLMEFLLSISVTGQQIVFEQIAAALTIGPLRLRLPRWLAPQITARTWFDDRRRTIEVRVSMTGPALVPLIEYDGTLQCQ